jgi:pimeloyl-ACP methyl ester carboxylesterase
MPTAVIDGIATRFEVVGSGPPLLMYSPAGFDATLEKWTTQGTYARVNMLRHLAERFSCIIFDRRECGRSGGRVERITWAHYAAQGKGLLDHLKINSAHLLGGCMGVCPVVAFGVAYPEKTISMTLWWPVGGAKYRINVHQRFAEHLAFVREYGLAQVASLAVKEGKSFSADPRVGPWASVLQHHNSFAERFAKLDIEKYKIIVASMSRTLFDRDTVPGAEPEDLLRLEIPTLVVPGHDASHATSASRYLEECLPKSEYWDVPVEEQTEERVAQHLLRFLEKNTATMTTSAPDL